jgi:uncharacterized protein
MLRTVLTDAAPAARTPSRSTAAARPETPAAVDLNALRATVAADHAIADPAHDIGHLDRVAALATWIAQRLGIDPRPAQIAAYVHDYHRVAEARTGLRPLPVGIANDLVRSVLDAHRVPPRWYPDVLCAVDVTGRYRIAGDALAADLVEVCPVAAAVHDADNLDALGVVGLARAVSYGALLGEPLWEPHAVIQATYAQGRSSSVLAHCYEKLVRLADEMLTQPGRELARLRLTDLLGVLGQLRTEFAAAPAQPAEEWDPRTGYLRLTLDTPAGQLKTDCRVAFTAEARIGLCRGRAGPRVCYLELSQLPAVARVTIAAVSRGAAAGAVAVCGNRLRIPVRRGVPHAIAAGSATVELEFAGGRPVAVTLHIAWPAPLPDAASLAAG